MVVLEVRLRDACVDSTRDVLEADTCEEAERQAVAALKTARPECTYRPLLTTSERP